MKSKTMTLADLPNLSFRLTEELACVGIDQVEMLRQAGAAIAWQQLQAAGFHPDYHVLLALQGAIEGKHWRDLTPACRLELRSAVPALS